ncbi:MAG: hypothetical protein IT385_15715 [Deltaproteobacteria bacterium]|nr:hypothetical protein [Deltaproteobacteria bacterium]
MGARRVNGSWCAAIVVALALGAPAARGDAPDSDAAYEEGKAALKAREHARALAAFERALATADDEARTWRAVLGLALGHELAGDALRGAVYYRRFLSRSAPSPLSAGPEWGPRRVEAAASAERLERSLAVTHAQLVITSTPSGRPVTIEPDTPNDCALTPCALFAPPGAYSIRVALTDDALAEQTVDAHAGRRHDVALEAARSVMVDPIAPPFVVEPAPLATTGSWPAAATWTVVGGGAAVVVGALFTGLAAADHDRLEDLSREPGTEDVLARYDATRTRMEARETTSWVLYALGGAAIATGLVLGLTADAPPTASSTRTFGWRF